MNLVQEFTIHANLKQPLPIGIGPIGTRMFASAADLLIRVTVSDTRSTVRAFAMIRYLSIRLQGIQRN